MKKLFTLTLILLAHVMVFAQANAIISIENKTDVTPGAGLNVAVDADFSSIDPGVSAFTLYIAYDNRVLDAPTLLNQSFSGIQSSTSTSGNTTTITVLWSDNAVVSQLNGKLFDLNFNYKGGNTALSFSNSSVGDASANLLPATFTNGAVEQLAITPGISVNNGNTYYSLPYKTIDVPVYGHQLYNIGGFELEMDFSSIVFDGNVTIVNRRNDLISRGSWTSSYAAGKVLVAWTKSSVDNVSIPEGEKLFDLRMNYTYDAANIVFDASSQIAQNVEPGYPAFSNDYFTNGAIGTTKADPTLTLPTAAGITYGQALSSASLNGGSASYTGAPNSGVVEGVYTYQDPTITPNAGTYTATVVFTPTNTTAYNVVTGTVDVEVTKAVLTATADNKTKVYGSANPELTFQYSGWVNGVETIDTPPTISTTVDGTTVVGTHEDAITLSGGIDNNYTFNLIAGDFEVTKAPQTITWSNPANIVVGTALSGTQLNATVAGVAGGSAPGELIYDPVAGTVLAVGDNQPLNVTAAATLNYTEATETVYINVLANTANISLTGGTFTFDGNGHAATGFAYGINGIGDVLSPDLTFSYEGTGTTTYGPTADAPVNVGTYEVTASFAGNATYAANSATANITILPKAITITPDASQSKIYGADDPTFTYTHTPLVGSDGFTGALGRATGETVLGSPYAYTLGNLSAGPNYTLSLTADPATFSITKKDLLVIADDKTKVYGVTDPVFTLRWDAFAFDDDPSDLGGSYVIWREVGEDVGQYEIRIINMLTSDNYNVIEQYGTLTIGQRDLTVINAIADNKIFDGNTDATISGGELQNIANSDDITIDSRAGTFAQSDVGIGIDVTANLTLAGEKAANYNLIQPTGLTADITALQIKVTAEAKSKTYGDIDPSLTFTHTPDLIGSDDFTGGLSRVTGENVGDYAIGQNDLALSANYTISYTGADLTINQLAVTVTADAKTKVYGEADPDLSFVSNPAVGSTLANNELIAFTGAITRVAGENVGNYEIQQGTLDNGNYSINYTSANMVITPKALSITAENKAKTYDGQTFTAFTVTYDGFITGEDESVLGGTLAFTGNATSATDAGNYTIIPGGLTSDNYAISFVNGTLSITTAALTITANNDTKVYDAVAYSGGNGVVYNGFVGSEDASVLGGTLSYTGTSQGAVNVGNAYVITPGGLTSDNYAINFVDGTLSITTAALTITANNDTKVYDAEAYSGGNGVVYNGFVGSEDASVLGGTLSYTGTSQGAVNVGNAYVITPGGLTSDNYAINFVDGTLSITTAALTITANNDTKVYDAVAYSGGNGVVYNGFAGSEDASVLGGTLSYTGTSQGAVNVGNAYVITPGGLTSDNYAISFVDGTLSITTAALTITANNDTKVYDAVAYSGGNGVVYSGFVGSEDEDDLAGTLAFSGNAQGAINHGTYAITPRGLTSENYAIQFVDGTLTIQKANASITVNGYSGIYDGLAHGASGQALGVQSEVLDGLVLGATFTNVPGGTADWTFTDVTGNYNNASGSVEIVIAAKALTVTAENKSKTYDAAVFPVNDYTVNYSGFENGEDHTVLGGTLAFTGDAIAAVDAGVYTITPEGLTSSNYAISFEDGTLTIGKANASITVNGYTGTYDGLAHGATGEARGVENELLSGLNLGESFTDVPGGTANWTFADVTGNYNDASGSVDITINKKALTVSVDNKSKVYDNAIFPVGNYTLSYDGFITGEDENVLGGAALYSGAGVSATNVGSYTVAVSGLTAVNYEISYTPGTLTITPAELTLILDNKSKTYGNIDPVFTITYLGLAPGDDASVVTGITVIYRIGGENVGAYTIDIFGTPVADNYTIVKQTGVFTINPRLLTVSGTSAESKNYDGTTITTINGGTLHNIVNGDNVVIDGRMANFTDPNAGTDIPVVAGMTLGGTAANNYSLVQPTGLLADIFKVDQTIAWDAPSAITYGTLLSETQLNAVASGVAGGSAPGELTYSPAIDFMLEAGADQVLTVNAAATNNYNAALKTVLITVNKADQSIAWSNPANIPYGTLLGVDQLNAVVSGVVGGSQTGDVTYNPASDALLGAGMHTLTVNVAGTDNYNPATANVQIVVDKIDQTLSWDTPSAIIYGTLLSDTQLNASVSGVSGGSLPGVLTYNPSAGTLLGAGTHTLTVTAAETDDYNETSTNVQLIVNKADQSITWNNPANIVYGSRLSATQLNAVVSGVAGGSAIGDVTYDPALNTLLNAGTHTLTVNVAATDDYNAATADVTIIVDKADQTISWATPAAITYGTLLGVDQLNASVAGVNDPDASAPGTLTYSPAAGAMLDAGNQTLSVTAAATSNYNEATETVNLLVNKAAQIISWANPDAITYGTALGATQLNATVSGVANGSDPGVLTYDPAAGTILTAGTHTLGVTAAETENYLSANASVNLLVDQLEVTVNADSKTKVYGETDPLLTYTYSPDLIGADVFTGEIVRATGEDVGNYAINQGSLALNANYTLTYNGAVFSISKRPITITAGNQSKTYGNAINLGNSLFAVSGTMAAGEEVTSVDLNSTGSAFDAFAGTYPIVASNASGTGGFDVSNYDITYTNGVLTVNPFELTLSNFAASPKSYDGTTMVTGTGFLDNRIIPSDNISYSFDVAFVDANAAVNKLVNYNNIAITGGTHGVNYSLSVNSGTAYATISPKALTITPDNITKTYNTTYVFAGDEFTTSGTVTGETIASVTLTSAGADASAAPGDYDIIASNAVAGASTSLDNYSITYAAGTLTVGSAGNMDLSAFVKYSKVGTDDLAMPGVTVQLLDGNNDVLYTSVTDQSGKYSFTNVPIADVAAIRADVNTALYCWAGVNATDAMVIQNHLVGNSPSYWQPVNFINHVADVTGNGTVTNSDPLALRYRVLYPDVPAYSFPSGDWAFSYNNTNMVNTGVATAELIAPVVNNQLADIAVRLFGDVNGSYVPCAGKRSADPVLTDDVLYVQQGVEFELPFRINNDALLGAMTIMLDYNPELIEVISLQSDIDGVYFSIDQNKLRIFWTNTNGLNLQANDNLFTLLVKTIAPVEAGMPLFFTDSQTEFADPDAVVINNLGLITFAVDNVFVGFGDQLEQQILLTAYPNPFREKIEISYEIPMNAKVNLSILNMQGVMINELVDQTQFAGKHTMGVSATADHLTPGVYVVRLQIHMDEKVIEKYHRIVSVR